MHTSTLSPSETVMLVLSTLTTTTERGQFKLYWMKLSNNIFRQRFYVDGVAIAVAQSYPQAGILVDKIVEWRGRVNWRA